MIWLENISAAQVVRHGLTYSGAVGTILFIMLGWARPQAEDFVRETVRQEKFATQEQLEQQTKALEELSESVQKQSDSQQEQVLQQTILQTDVATIKALQKQTLDAILNQQ